ncbi:carph-isopro domain-containing protein [Novosphingobium guangzhouense]|uniref:carph-isopro domain-containing protein n=1 Tax=Novosphingobium guangzhouense TaxID=1850347 RepID=UPI003CCB9AA9
MERLTSIFDLFGGVRPMARALGESPSKIAAWKRAGHIPAQKQAEVLEKGTCQGLALTAENVVFPLGRPSDVANTITATPAPVACPAQAEVQRTGAAQ